MDIIRNIKFMNPKKQLIDMAIKDGEHRKPDTEFKRKNDLK